MENASKALIIATTVLLGVMLITFATVLFTSFANYSKDVQEERENNALAEFNNRFIKYYNGSTGEKDDKEPILVTIHDIVSIANLAKETNIKNELQEEIGYSNVTSYIQIDLESPTVTNFEKKSSNEYTKFINQNDIIYNEDGTTKNKYYYCKSVNFNQLGELNHMVFIPYKK